MPHIKTIGYDEADESLRQVYDSIIGSRGKLAEVHKIQSLNPAALSAHIDLYKVVMFGSSPLKRYQREMIAVVVSAANKCRYCVEHHLEALRFYWKDETKIESLLDAQLPAEWSETDLALCRFAKECTLHPDQYPADAIINLRSAGLEDRTILDAVQVVAYFNFVNRIVLALGVEWNDDEAKGYRY